MSEEDSLPRGRVVKITNPDVTNENPRYWEQVLASHGLAMSAGSPSRKMVPNVGNINDLVKLENAVYEQETGRVKPKGHGPDGD